MIDTALKDTFIHLIEDSRSNGVPELHFRFWNRADEAAKAQYLERFHGDVDAMQWFDEGYLGDDPDFDALLTLDHATLGYQYARHVIDNGLNETIASDYRTAHEQLDAAGRLDGMPDEVKYAVVRGFQIHDIFHVVTGYKTNGWGEIALKTFTLAQRQLPYLLIWMATLTAQMTFVSPDMTVGVMDAISHGWQHGRTAKNLNYTRWEEHFAESVDDLRARYNTSTHREGAA